MRVDFSSDCFGVTQARRSTLVERAAESPAIYVFVYRSYASERNVVDAQKRKLFYMLPPVPMIEFTLRLPPSANRLWRRSGRRIHKSADYTAWLREAA